MKAYEPPTACYAMVSNEGENTKGRWSFRFGVFLINRNPWLYE